MNRLIQLTQASLTVFLFLISLHTQANNDTLALDDDLSVDKNNHRTLRKVSRYIIEEKKDSAALFFQEINTDIYQRKDSWYFFKAYDAIQSILKTDELDYTVQSDFIDYFSNEVSFSPQEKNEYVQRVITEPSDKKKINLEYVFIKERQITNLRNSISVEEATAVNTALETYIDQFNPQDPEVTRAKGYPLSHKIVLTQIQRNIPLGFQLCREQDSIGTLIKDTLLIVSARYYYTELLVNTGDIDQFLAKGEELLPIAKHSSEGKRFYIGIVENLINGYIYKRGHDERLWELFDIMDGYANVKHLTYEFYTQYLNSLPPDSPYLEKIYNRFNSSNFIEFSQKLIENAEKELEHKRLTFFYNQMSRALFNREQYQMAMQLLQKSNSVTEKIYSENLSKSIAQVETEYAVKSKEKEIEAEKEKNRLTVFIAGLSIALLLVFIFFFFRTRKQNQLLAQKNEEIAAQRDDIAQREEEKAMLLKEVHHRVKNNFQIISSLLELQSKGIEDQKALELAQEGKNRVQSMALIHQKLYQNDDLLIYFDDYIDKLVKELVNMYGVGDEIRTQVNINHLSFDIDTAIPLGLIVNELVTNAMKYGFQPNDKQLEIAISKKSEEEYELLVKDNGTGLSDAIDLDKVKSIGLRLVRRLAKQLHGKVTYSNENGCTFTVTFKDSLTRSLVD